MKTFLTLAVALTLGSVVALGVAGCDNKPVAPPAKVVTPKADDMKMDKEMMDKDKMSTPKVVTPTPEAPKAPTP